jgi:hypothetical protein
VLPDVVKVVSLAQGRDNRQRLIPRQPDDGTDHDHLVMHGCDALDLHAIKGGRTGNQDQKQKGCNEKGVTQDNRVDRRSNVWFKLVAAATPHGARWSPASTDETHAAWRDRALQLINGWLLLLS